MPSKELIESVIEAIVKNQPKVTRFKDMETLELSEVVDYTPTAQAAISTIHAALKEPTERMIDAYFDQCRTLGFTSHINATAAWSALLAASALGEQGE